jgi:hypothetical protein
MMQDKDGPQITDWCRFLIPILPSIASASFGTAVRLPDLIISGAGLSVTGTSPPPGHRANELRYSLA